MLLLICCLGVMSCDRMRARVYATTTIARAIDDEGGRLLMRSGSSGN